jgi:predicted nucleotidyltransferase/septum formation topological specificity factor MinE
MNDDSRYLLALVEKTVPIYAANPKMRAQAVVGSVARGQSDQHSDIDMTVYYETLPTEAEVVAAREQISGVFGDWYWQDPDEAGFGEYYFLKGVKVDVGHVTIAYHENFMADVLERYETDIYKQKALSGMCDALPLYGHEQVQKWIDRAAAYPPELAPKMVQEYLRFTPPWILSKMVAERGDLLWLYQLLVKAEENLMGVMFGLNHMYHTADFKRLDWVISKMHTTPPDFANRLKVVLRSEPQAAVQQLVKLQEETLALVEQHMPEVDTTRVRQRFSLPYMGWTRQ